ncbi:hypothetical protein ACFXDJ_33350 [Streptomyces sp. NPDC059443]|uniref:hypothetical protein n=1 Tax=unclassified Streptomyces TaxID=2593676 RepID=UPI00368EDD17
MRVRTAFPAALASLGALGLVLLSPAAAHAHGDTVKVVVTGERAGHVTAEVTWENDGEAVTSAVAATVNAVSGDGTRTLGPWPLIRDPAAPPAGWHTVEILPPGSWKVSVDVGFPALGHGEREVGVPVADPAPSTAAPSPAAPTPAPSPEPAAAAAKGGAAWWTVAGVAVTALAGAGVGMLLRRRRGRRGA